MTSLDPEKMNKLRSDLATVQQNCKVFGDLLTEVSRGGGSGSTSDLELLEVGQLLELGLGILGLCLSFVVFAFELLFKLLLSQMLKNAGFIFI